ncbi:MAG: hypothetical protein BWY21_02337 [Parcubacteria group bacterium ADurb.Bin216]|nr:MAG: hypothetical protein BWY21_02337 [Parcubacteria group bacterium ADurb.Bin216]
MEKMKDKLKKHFCSECNKEIRQEDIDAGITASNVCNQCRVGENEEVLEQGYADSYCGYDGDSIIGT